MLVFNREQRTLLAETLRDIANIAAGAMIFGQFFADETFSPRIAVEGLAVWGSLVAFSLFLMGRKH